MWQVVGTPASIEHVARALRLRIAKIADAADGAEDEFADSDAENPSCSMCLDEMSPASSYELQACGHRFDQGCLAEHVVAAVDPALRGAGLPILCPFPGAVRVPTCVLWAVRHLTHMVDAVHVALQCKRRCCAANPCTWLTFWRCCRSSPTLSCSSVCLCGGPPGL